MWKTRILLIFLATALIILLFNLPRVVVDDEENQETPETANPQLPMASPGQRATGLSDADLEKFSDLREKFRNNDNKEKSAIFADSLASLYAERGVYDSAAWYYSWIAEQTEEGEWLLKAGNMYYQAFESAPDGETAAGYGLKAREYLGEYLEGNPGNLSAKTKVAMTFVASESPMQGVSMLMEVLEEDPENVAALYNLGVLSLQTSQYDKAVERFERLVELEPENVSAHFYLGFSLMKLGRNEAARERFEMVKELGRDPEIQAAAENYLDELNN